MQTEGDIRREFGDLWPNAESPGTSDDDDRDDEHADENEIPVRETDEATEAPEEFEIDDEDEPDVSEDEDELHATEDEDVGPVAPDREDDLDEEDLDEDDLDEDAPDEDVD